MANTPYIDLVKPAGTDKALISVLNANSDKIDSAVGGVQDALAIVCNGNTHGAITSGQYVYVRAHDTLQEGLYTANSNIAANATLSSSNLTANSSGGLNTLSEQIGNINAIEITASGADESAMMANAVSQISQFSGTRAFSITWTNNNVGFLLYNYDKRRVLLDTGNAIFAGVVSSNRSSVTLNELALSSKLLKYVDVEFSNESVTQEGSIWYCSKNLTSEIGSGKTLVSASFISGTMFGVIPSLNHYTNALYIQKLSSGAYSGKIRVFYTD